MIIDLPNKDDFYRNGLSMLNLAWDSIAALYFDIEYSELEDWDDGEVKEEFWQAAQHNISIALALSQQGIELLLKGRIAEVSPFLLLAGSPRDWPAKCTEDDVPFADFRTIDAHELIRAYDTVISDQLKESFKTQFERLRRMRNIIFHGADKKARPTSVDVFRVILEALDNLYKPKSWIHIRRSYLENAPKSVVYSTDGVEIILVSEALYLIKVLTPAETKRYLGFNKKQRKYICYTCKMNCSETSISPEIAILDPNKPTSTQVYCFVCDKHYPVVRKSCDDDNCKGNVLDEEDSVCLTCG